MIFNDNQYLQYISDIGWRNLNSVEHWLVQSLRQSQWMLVQQKQILQIYYEKLSLCV